MTQADTASAPGAPKRRLTRLLPAAFGLLTSVLFGFLAARGVDWDAARQALGRVQWFWVIVYTVALIGVQGLKMVRWSLLLHALGETRWRRSLSVGAVGLAAIFFFPARLGELVRPVLIGEETRVKTGEAAATVVVERLIDGLLIGLMLVGVGAWVSDALPTAERIRSAGWIVGGIFLGLAAGILLSVRFIGLFHRLNEAIFGRWPKLSAKLDGLVSSFRDGLITLGRTHHVWAYLALSASVWLFSSLAILLLFVAIGAELPVSAAFVVLLVTSVGILVPAAPTAIGTFHFAAVWALGLYQVDEAVALNFAIVFHLCQVAALLLTGLGGIVAGGLSLQGLREAVGKDGGRRMKDEG